MLKDNLLEDIRSRLEADPLFYADLLRLSLEYHDKYVVALAKQRNTEASNAINHLCCAIVDKKFFKKASWLQRIEMQHVISYHFADGSEGYSNGEKEFYKKYGPVENKDNA